MRVPYEKMYNEFVRVLLKYGFDKEKAEISAKLYADAKAGSNSLSIVAAGNDGQFTVTALFDNLGKGASGAAVQNMNLMLGLEETTGLI